MSKVYLLDRRKSVGSITKQMYYEMVHLMRFLWLKRMKAKYFQQHVYMLAGGGRVPNIDSSCSGHTIFLIDSVISTRTQGGRGL